MLSKSTALYNKYMHSIKTSKKMHNSNLRPTDVSRTDLEVLPLFFFDIHI